MKPSCGKRGRSMKHLLRFRLLNRPEPPKPVEFDKTKPTMPPVNIKPAAPKVPDAPVPSMGEKVPVDVKRPDSITKNTDGTICIE